MILGLILASAVLLTFDVDLPADVEAQPSLGLAEPATYFVSGEIADKHPELAARLAAQSTVGSSGYAHQDLTSLAPEALHRDLLLGKLVLEEAIRRPALWFRAPFLKLDPQAAAEVRALGFRYDSSLSEAQWDVPGVLPQLPISTLGDGTLLASDHDLFVDRRTTDAEALALLIGLYERKSRTGQPAVLSLHPRVIALHREMLERFVAHVRQAGGVFQTADGYLVEQQARRPRRLATWINFQLGAHQPEMVRADLAQAGITDAFLMARDPDGKRYDAVFAPTAALLRQAGIRVHAWLPVGMNRARVMEHPEWAMVAEDGTRSPDWVSFLHPEARRALLQDIAGLAAGGAVDGIHLDYLRYPGLDYDYSPAAREAFRANGGPLSFPAWREEQVTLLAREIRAALPPEMTLSAALIAEAAVSRRARERFGQDYQALGLDLFVPMAYFKEEGQPVEWISKVVFGARAQIGPKPLLIALEGYQRPGRWSLSQPELEQAVSLAAPGADGLAVYPYLYSFGRGPPEWSLAPGGLAVFRRALPGPAPLWRRTSVRVAGALTLLALAIFVARRLRRMPAPGAPLPAGPAPDWRPLEKAILGGAVTGLVAEQVSAVMHQYGARTLERFRQAFVLECVEESRRIALEGIPHWEILAQRHLAEARELGLVEEERVTALGRQRLAEARRDGYQRALLEFLERRLHETLLAACPRCGATSEAHWFWATLECAECRERSRLAESPSVAIGAAVVELRRYEVV